MSNVLTNLFQTKVVPGLYQQYFQGSTTSWMESNAIGVEYTGGKYVVMHEMTVDGLGDYSRQLGYPRGNIGGNKVQYELTKDRGREFLIDAADNDETGFLVNAASVMTQFQRDHVIPEVDAYRISQIYAKVLANNNALVSDSAIEKDTITDLLLADIATIQDRVGNVPLVIMMSGITQAFFGHEFIHNLDYANFSNGQLFTKVRALDGNPFMIIPSARMKSAYTYLDGVTAGQEAGGFTASVGAEDIKWIITPATGPIAVGKIDKMRAFSPEEYQAAHAWKVDYRLYHDIWMTSRALDNSFIRTGDIS